MKNLLYLFFLCSFITFSQQNTIPKLGQTSIDELLMTNYSKDSSAIAVVLYEKGNYRPHKTDKFSNVIEYYFRVKILKNEGLSKASITIEFLKDEKIIDIKANSSFLNKDGNIEKKPISEDDIIRDEQDENIKKVILNIPNVRIGSVIEYSYAIVSPFFEIRDWHFQTDIPKIRSEFVTLFPDERKYMARLLGRGNLSASDSTKVVQCYVGTSTKQRCETNLYRMDSVQAFEPEVMMISPEILLSRMDFNMKLLVDRYGRRLFSATSDWKEFDREFQYILEGDKQDDARFYKRRLPKEILKEKDPLKRAKDIYYFVQNHFTWNRYLGGSITQNLRKRFKSKNGSVNLINSSLFNSLTSAKISCSYVLMSTRGNGIPESEVPIPNDFNYLIVMATINGKDYFLDATEKGLAFGLVPTRIGNTTGRVMDFDNGSYWRQVKPSEISTKDSRIDLRFDDEMNLTGSIKIQRSGMAEFKARKKYKELNKEKYIESIEERIPYVSIANLEFLNVDSLEENFIETQTVSFLNEDVNRLVSDTENRILFNPVLFDQLSINPFKSDKRNYKLDFIYKFKNIYRQKIQIPEGYQVVRLPENMNISIPDQGGSYMYRIGQTENEIQLFIKLHINKKVFSVEEYANLKDIFSKITKAESSTIELQKK